MRRMQWIVCIAWVSEEGGNLSPIPLRTRAQNGTKAIDVIVYDLGKTTLCELQEKQYWLPEQVTYQNDRIKTFHESLLPSTTCTHVLHRNQKMRYWFVAKVNLPSVRAILSGWGYATVNLWSTQIEWSSYVTKQNYWWSTIAIYHPAIPIQFYSSCQKKGFETSA